MPNKKESCKEESDKLRENTSPVCYLNSPELRPEFEEELTPKAKIKKAKNRF